MEDILYGKTLVALGDSLFYGCKLGNEATWINKLGKKHNMTVYNHGINGNTLAKQDKEPQNPPMCIRYADMEDADVVVVFGGTNDYGHGDAPLGSFSDRTPDTFYGACHYLYSGLVKKYLGKTIVIMTPLHRVAETKNTGSVKQYGYGTLRDYVQIIREVAEYYSIPVLDLYSISGLQPEIKEIQDTYMPDGVHPNDNGHAVIANKLKAFLETL